MTWGKVRKVRKYRAGERLNSLAALVLIINDGRYIIVNGRPYHPAVLRNWSLASLDGAMRRGRMYLAELTPEWIEDQEMRAELAKFNAEHPDDSEFAEVEAGEKP